MNKASVSKYDILLSVIIFIIFIVSIILIVNRDYFVGYDISTSSESKKIPKKIYTFWHSEILPEILQKCIKTWSYHNPDYEIIVMNFANYRNYCSEDILAMKHIDKFKNIQRTSDFIRLAVLKENGGIWLDISSVCTSSFDSLLSSDKNGIILYASRFGYKYPVLENWFIACEKNSPFILEWYNVFIKGSQQFDDYKLFIDNLDSKIVYNKDMWNGVYWGMHKSAQVIIQYSKYPLTKITILDAFVGPFLYIALGYATKKLFNDICNIKDISIPFIKFTRHTRPLLEQSKIVQACLFDSLNNNNNKKILDASNILNNDTK